MDFLMKTLDPKTPPSLAILSLPTTLLLAALPHWYTIYLAQSNKVQGGWANENPRAFVARLNAKAAMGKKLSDLEEKILRGQSAQQNAFEWWAMWAVAVVFGVLVKVPTSEMHNMALLHLTLRVIYTILYVETSSRKFSFLRTAAFQASLIPAIRLFFKGAYNL